MNDKAILAEFWRFPWPIMDVLIGGRSSIDLPELRVHDREQATAFLKSYGYDPDDPRQAMRLHAVLIEAIAFIEKRLTGPREWTRVKPPDEIMACDDPRWLLIWASGKDPAERLKRAWACAVLRVMHTIGHIEGVIKMASLPAAREQIQARFDRYLFRDAERKLWLGEGQDRIRVEKVEWKPEKTRHSIILKLLHKRDNVAETIYDYLGVRIVTTRLCDVMACVKLLHKLNMVSFPNCYPARARNTLIDVPRFRSQLETLRDMLMAGSITPEEFDAMMGRLTAMESVQAPQNPHTLATYRSIQLTGRQMIRVKSERFEWLEKLERELDQSRLPGEVSRILGEMKELVRGWHSLRTLHDEGTFFPFEVQIMDQDAYRDATSGQAAHDRYKLSQIRAARKRVLTKVLELSKERKIR